MAGFVAPINTPKYDGTEFSIIAIQSYIKESGYLERGVSIKSEPITETFETKYIEIHE